MNLLERYKNHRQEQVESAVSLHNLIALEITEKGIQGARGIISVLATTEEEKHDLPVMLYELDKLSRGERVQGVKVDSLYRHAFFAALTGEVGACAALLHISGTDNMHAQGVALATAYDRAMKRVDVSNIPVIKDKLNLAKAVTQKIPQYTEARIPAERLQSYRRRT